MLHDIKGCPVNEGDGGSNFPTPPINSNYVRGDFSAVGDSGEVGFFNGGEFSGISINYGGGKYSSGGWDSSRGMDSAEVGDSSCGISSGGGINSSVGRDTSGGMDTGEGGDSAGGGDWC